MKRKQPPPESGEAGKTSPFHNLPIEGWFWELVRRDETYRKRFKQIGQDALEYAASRLDPHAYRAKLRSYFSHMWRFGVQPTPPSATVMLSAFLNTKCYLFLPLPGREEVIAVPRPDVKYADFGQVKPALRGSSPRWRWSRLDEDHLSAEAQARERIALIMQILKNR